MDFLEFLWGLLIIMGMIYFFMILFFVLVDLFRDKDTSGWAKAGWLVFMLILPFIGVLIYLIARGKGMQERRAAEAAAAQQQFDAYVREQAGAAASPAEEIARAKALLDAGTITEAEYQQMKAKALAA
ncbi:MAG: SHOCT domain-containing protein [Thermoleophilia bacterium]|jgi:hypothetical protein|nr:SHOCT domain-containing protein [Thermoleophilia bacterium]